MVVAGETVFDAAVDVRVDTRHQAATGGHAHGRRGMGVLKEDQINIIVHGHNPVVSEMIAQATADEDILQLAREKGANGINLVGLCCTGNELLMRRGIPMAGNHLMTEQVLMTGAVEMMLVDYQCIMPSLGQIGSCYHTRMISTSDKAKFPGMR